MPAFLKEVFEADGPVVGLSFGLDSEVVVTTARGVALHTGRDGDLHRKWDLGKGGAGLTHAAVSLVAGASAGDGRHAVVQGGDTVRILASDADDFSSAPAKKFECSIVHVQALGVLTQPDLAACDVMVVDDTPTVQDALLVVLADGTVHTMAISDDCELSPLQSFQACPAGQWRAVSACAREHVESASSSVSSKPQADAGIVSLMAEDGDAEADSEEDEQQQRSASGVGLIGNSGVYTIAVLCQSSSEKANSLSVSTLSLTLRQRQEEAGALPSSSVQLSAALALSGPRVSLQQPAGAESSSRKGSHTIKLYASPVSGPSATVLQWLVSSSLWSGASVQHVMYSSNHVSAAQQVNAGSGQGQQRHSVNCTWNVLPSTSGAGTSAAPPAEEGGGKKRKSKGGKPAAAAAATAGSDCAATVGTGGVDDWSLPLCGSNGLGGPVLLLDMPLIQGQAEGQQSSSALSCRLSVCDGLYGAIWDQMSLLNDGQEEGDMEEGAGGGKNGAEKDSVLSFGRGNSGQAQGAASSSSSGSVRIATCAAAGLVAASAGSSVYLLDDGAGSASATSVSVDMFHPASGSVTLLAARSKMASNTRKYLVPRGANAQSAVASGQQGCADVVGTLEVLQQQQQQQQQQAGSAKKKTSSPQSFFGGDAIAKAAAASGEAAAAAAGSAHASIASAKSDAALSSAVSAYLASSVPPSAASTASVSKVGGKRKQAPAPEEGKDEQGEQDDVEDAAAGAGAKPKKRKNIHRRIKESREYRAAAQHARVVDMLLNGGSDGRGAAILHASHGIICQALSLGLEKRWWGAVQLLLSSGCVSYTQHASYVAAQASSPSSSPSSAASVGGGLVSALLEAKDWNLIKTALAHVHDLSEIAVITFLKAALAAREEEEKGRGSTSSAVEEAPEGSASAAVRVVIKLCLEAPHCPEFMHDAVAAMLNSGEVMSLLLYLTDCCLEPPRYLGKQGATDGAAAAEQSEGGGAAGKKAKKAKKAADLSAIESQVSAAPLAAPSHLPRMQIVQDWLGILLDAHYHRLVTLKSSHALLMQLAKAVRSQVDACVFSAQLGGFLGHFMAKIKAGAADTNKIRAAAMINQRTKHNCEVLVAPGF